MDMTVAHLAEPQTQGRAPVNYDQCSFSMSGTCPHCDRGSVFTALTRPPHNEVLLGAQGTKSWSLMQCPGCLKFIVGGVHRDHTGKCDLIAHYPIGKPADDDVSEHIPPGIATDLREALRCRRVEAMNATAEMCRRAIQQSCISLGAPAGLLTPQIDWVHKNGTITTQLKDVAHVIRLGGNRGAHASESEAPLTEYEVDGLLEFTKHFMDIVYVIPAKLSRFDFSKAARKAQSAP
jgi:hypothetical protein